MRINDVERFALLMIFHGDDSVSVAVRNQLEELVVLSRSGTGVGFLSTMKLAAPLPDSNIHQRDWNFEHRQLSHGGSFMCWTNNPGSLDLEGVVHYGEWPHNFDASDFREIV